MPSVWKTVRVFISSTFRDMHAERDHLIKVVFPALRERLEKYRIYLDDIDLRWGVTKEQAENDQVLDLCLQQIDECRPFFIGILGERYGWVPTQFPVQTLSQQGWVQYHTGKSVTDLEMVYGVLTKPGMRRHAFFYFRDLAALADIPEEIRSTTFAETDPERIGNLADLKQRIRRNGYRVMDPYPAHWDARVYDRPSRSYGRLVGLEAFGERVREQLWEAIKAEHNLPDAPPAETARNPLAVELDYHERFMESRLRVHVLREQINGRLLAFAEADGTVPCLVTGPSGSGKSASLARFVMDYQRAHPDALVVPHFIGASPRSTNLREMLRRFCQVLKARLGLADEVPEEVTKLAVAFLQFIGKAPPDMRFLFVIDALNQLDEADRAQNLAWLPVQFPPQMKFVVSCISDSGKAEPALEALARRQHISLTVGPLDDEERRKIIQAVPSLSAKTLDSHQIDQLLANPATRNPLFLLVALEELRGFGSFEQINQRIADFPREGDTVTAIFTQVIERLEKDFEKPKDGVRTVLTLLASARRGLSDRELLDLVEGPGVAMTGSQSDLFPILRQLRPYLLRRAGLFDFYHRNLLKAVRGRYLDSADKLRDGHARLAAYFHAQGYWLESLPEQRSRANRLPAPRTANVRKVDELPWQRLRAEQWDETSSLLTDLSFLEAKAEAGLEFELADDFTQARFVLPLGHPAGQRLELLEEALRQDLHFIRRHREDYSQGLFQCLWNQCWWFDCPQAARHYQEGEVPGRGKGAALYQLLDRWRQEKEATTPGFVWLRSLRPPPQHLGVGLKAVLGIHTSMVNGVAFSPDGAWVASSGSFDHAVRIWDTHGGTEIYCLRGKSFLRGVAFSPDGTCVAAGSDDHLVWVWDIRSGETVARLEGHSYSVQCVAFSPDSNRIASGSHDNTVRLWDVRTGVELARIEGHQAEVNSVAFSPDGRLIVSGSSDNTIRLWDAITGEARDCLGGHQLNPHARTSQAAHPSNNHICVGFSPDGSLLVSGGQDHMVCLWNARSGSPIACLRGHSARVTGVAFSPDGALIASGSFDHTVRLWDVRSGEPKACWQGHTNYVRGVAFSPDSSLVVSGSDDHTVRLWDTRGIRPPVSLEGHAEALTCLTFNPEGSLLVTGSASQTVCFWNGHTGERVDFLPELGSSIRTLEFSPDGSRLVIGLGDCTARIWDIRKRVELVCLTGHIGPLISVGFTPDGTRVVTASHDWTTRVWDASSGVCLEKQAGIFAFKESVARPDRFLRHSDLNWLETPVALSGTGCQAWIPLPLTNLDKHPSGPLWAGSVGQYLALFCLEGEPSG